MGGGGPFFARVGGCTVEAGWRWWCCVYFHEKCGGNMVYGVHGVWFRAGKISERCRGVDARWKGLNF